MTNILSKSEAFQKREIVVTVRTEGLREAVVEIVAAREGWKLSFQQGPVSQFEKAEDFAKMTSEDVIFGVANFLSRAVSGPADIMRSLEEHVRISALPAAESSPPDDGPSADALALLEAEKTIEALEADKADLQEKLASSTNYVADSEKAPSEVKFENGRIVRIAGPTDSPYLEVEFLKEPDPVVAAPSDPGSQG